MFKSLFNKKPNFYSIKTFTYYIPSPPYRKNGYRETEFDSIISKISQMGYTLIDINTQSHSSEEKSGMWVVCTIGAKTKEIDQKEIIVETQEVITNSSDIELDPSIVHEL